MTLMIFARASTGTCPIKETVKLHLLLSTDSSISNDKNERYNGNKNYWWYDDDQNGGNADYIIRKSNTDTVMDGYSTTESHMIDASTTNGNNNMDGDVNDGGDKDAGATFAAVVVDNVGDDYAAAAAAAEGFDDNACWWCRNTSYRWCCIWASIH